MKSKQQRKTVPVQEEKGRPILVEFPDSFDRQIEAERRATGLTRAAFVRQIVLRSLTASARMSA